MGKAMIKTMKKLNRLTLTREGKDVVYSLC
jgi:hypothetical protein